MLPLQHSLGMRAVPFRNSSLAIHYVYFRAGKVGAMMSGGAAGEENPETFTTGRSSKKRTGVGCSFELARQTKTRKCSAGHTSVLSSAAFEPEYCFYFAAANSMPTSPHVRNEPPGTTSPLAAYTSPSACNRCQMFG